MNNQQEQQPQYIIIFKGMTADLIADYMNHEFIEIDFHGQMMVQFKNDNGLLSAVNGMNGYGDNIREDIDGIKAEIYLAILPAQDQPVKTLQEQTPRIDGWDQLDHWYGKPSEQVEEKPEPYPVEYPGKYYQPLFDHMSEEHGLTLLVSQMQDIIEIVKGLK